MNDHDYDEHLGQTARAQLERAARDIDELTLARLRAARLRALAAGGGRRGERAWWWASLPMAAAAAIVAVSAIGFLWQSPQPQTEMIAVLTEDVDLLLRDSPDFFDDIDFYEWLDAQEKAS